MPEASARKRPPSVRPATGSTRPALRAMLPWLALALLVAVADQWTKLAVLDRLHPGQMIPYTSFFDLVLVFNSGAAFSFLADHDGWQRWFFTGLAALICIWLLALMYQHRDERLQPAAFGLIIGGAVGNVYDRMVHGAVVDFLHFHYAGYSWPAFNLADSAITVGVVLMLWAQFRGGRQHVSPDPEK